MEFDKSRVYTALNTDELKPGDKVLTSNNIASLKEAVRLDVEPSVIETIWEEMYDKRFRCKSEDTIYDAELAYLVERAENCTNCRVKQIDHEGKIFCVKKDDKVSDELYCCELYAKEKTEQKAEPKTERAEKKYRPFKDTDELLETWEKKAGKWEDRLWMPFIWVRQKECERGGLLITYFGEDEVKTDMGFLTMRKLLADFTFTDGTPCGAEE